MRPDAADASGLAATARADDALFRHTYIYRTPHARFGFAMLLPRRFRFIAPHGLPLPELLDHHSYRWLRRSQWPTHTACRPLACLPALASRYIQSVMTASTLRWPALYARE